MRVTALLALLLVASCGASVGSGGQRPCTEIGVRVGIGVDIDAGLAAEAATLRTCWGGSCRTYPVDLFQSTAATDSTCAGDRPDDVCSARLRPTGGQHGFADIADLPERPVEVTLTVTGAGGERLAHRTLSVTPTPVYPNGPDCGAGGPQSNLVVDPRGMVSERA
ncbi:hypothetical protein [Saccharomonospora amisosensis]|uniref:hypothetical protein n=1 Tax=Saccharomonospora amisosensis TaxID=1128677 RepID=UPI0014216A2B|nr:hypothetical protein [Saccharomonospora amisosensis]